MHGHKRSFIKLPGQARQTCAVRLDEQAAISWEARWFSWLEQNIRPVAAATMALILVWIVAYSLGEKHGVMKALAIMGGVQ